MPKDCFGMENNMNLQTNWEWYIENDPNALKNMCISFDCSECLAEYDCKKDNGYSGCKFYRSEWLNTPHKELEHCPFCGEVPQRLKNDDEFTGEIVHCCRVVDNEFRMSENAWNTRYDISEEK